MRASSRSEPGLGYQARGSLAELSGRVGGASKIVEELAEAKPKEPWPASSAALILFANPHRKTGRVAWRAEATRPYEESPG